MRKKVKKIICLFLCVLLVISVSIIEINVTVKGEGIISNENGHFENEVFASNQKMVMASNGTQKITVSENSGNKYLILPSPDSELPSGKMAYAFSQSIVGLDTASEYYISFRFKCQNTTTGWAFMVGLFDNVASLGSLPYAHDWKYITPTVAKVSTGGASFIKNAESYGGMISDVTSTEWQYVTIRFTPNNAWTSLVFTPYTVSPGNIFIDDIIIGKVDVPNEKIQNGDFNNGTYDSWDKTESTSYCQVTSDPVEPSNPVLYIPKSGKQQQRNISQRLNNLIVGKKYLLSFRMKYSNITATELSWQNFVGVSTKAPDFSASIWGNIEPENISYDGMNFARQPIGQDATGLMKVSADSSTEWHEYNISFIADSETLYFYFNNYYGKADVYLDDFKLTLYYQKYDVNCDENVDIIDLVVLKKHLCGISVSAFNELGADIDENNSVDSLDMVFMRKKLLGISSNIKVLNFDTTTKTYEGFSGVSALYSGHHFHDDTTWKQYSDEELAWEIEQLLNSGISMVRANFYVSWTWDYENNRYDYNTSDMKAFYEYAQLLKDNGITIGIVLNDTIYESFDTRKTPFVLITGGTDHDACSDEMGKFASDFVNEVIIDRGFDNIEYIEMFTEPGNEYFSNSYTTEQRKAEFDKNLKYYKAIHEQLTADGLRDKIKIMGPNVAMHHLVEPYVTYANDWLKWAVEYGDDYIDVYSMHTYSRLSYTTDDYESWMKFIEYARDIIEPTGKKFFIDEFGYGYSDGTSDKNTDGKLYNNLTGVHLANAYVAMMNSGFVSGGTIWSLADEKWPGRYNTNDSFTSGIQISGYGIPNLRLSNELKPNYYLISALGKAVKSGCTVYSGSSSGGVNATYIVNADGTTSIVVVNMSSETVDCVFNFNSDIGVSSLYRYEYGQNTVAKDIFSSFKTVDSVSERFINSVSPYTVVIYSSSVMR